MTVITLSSYGKYFYGILKNCRLAVNNVMHITSISCLQRFHCAEIVSNIGSWFAILLSAINFSFTILFNLHFANV